MHLIKKKLEISNNDWCKKMHLLDYDSKRTRGNIPFSKKGKNRPFQFYTEASYEDICAIRTGSDLELALACETLCSDLFPLPYVGRTELQDSRMILFDVAGSVNSINEYTNHQVDMARQRICERVKNVGHKVAPAIGFYGILLGVLPGNCSSYPKARMVLATSALDIVKNRFKDLQSVTIGTEEYIDIKSQQLVACYSGLACFDLDYNSYKDWYLTLTAEEVIVYLSLKILLRSISKVLPVAYFANNFQMDVKRLKPFYENAERRSLRSVYENLANASSDIFLNVLDCDPVLDIAPYIKLSEWKSSNDANFYYTESCENEPRLIEVNIITGDIFVNGQGIMYVPDKIEKHNDFKNLMQSEQDKNVIITIPVRNIGIQCYQTTEQPSYLKLENHSLHFVYQSVSNSELIIQCSESFDLKTIKLKLIPDGFDTVITNLPYNLQHKQTLWSIIDGPEQLQLQKYRYYILRPTNYFRWKKQTCSTIIINSIQKSTEYFQIQNGKAQSSLYSILLEGLELFNNNCTLDRTSIFNRILCDYKLVSGAIKALMMFENPSRWLITQKYDLTTLEEIVEIHLYRYNLSFVVKQNNLHSLNFPSFTVSFDNMHLKKVRKSICGTSQILLLLHPTKKSKLLIPQSVKNDPLNVAWKTNYGVKIDTQDSKGNIRIDVASFELDFRLQLPRPTSACSALLLARIFMICDNEFLMDDWNILPAEKALELLRSTRSNRWLSPLETNFLNALFNDSKHSPEIRLICCYIKQLADPHFIQFEDKPEKLNTSLKERVQCRTIPEIPEIRGDLIDVLSSSVRYSYGRSCRMKFLPDELQWACSTLPFSPNSFREINEKTKVPLYSQFQSDEIYSKDWDDLTEYCVESVSNEKEVEELNNFEKKVSAIVKQFTSEKNSSDVVTDIIIDQIQKGIQSFKDYETKTIKEECLQEPKQFKKKIEQVLKHADSISAQSLSALKNLQQQLCFSNTNYFNGMNFKWIPSINENDCMEIVLDASKSEYYFPSSICREEYRIEAYNLSKKVVANITILLSCTAIKRHLKQAKNDNDNDSDVKLKRDIIREITRPLKQIILSYPEFLVFEACNDLRIRESQLELFESLMAQLNDAKAGNTNSHGTISQLNMGEGKTQVVLPLLLLYSMIKRREENRSLPFAHVPSALLSETEERLRSCLTTLPGMPVMILQYPFCRKSLPANQNLEEIKTEIDSFLSYSRSSARIFNAVVLTAKETVLSRKLKAKELVLYAPKNQSKNEIIATSKKLSYEGVIGVDTSKQVHIFDEVDLALDPQSVLVYAVGASNSNPPQCDLRKILIPLIVKIYISILIDNEEGLAKLFEPSYGEFKQDSKFNIPQGFRLLNTSDDESQSKLLKFVVKKIYNSSKEETPELASLHCFRDEMEFYSFVTDPEINTSDKKWYSKVSETTMLLRGMFAYGTLEHALKMRYRIEYGPPVSFVKKQMVVPYACADVPKIRSEFQHYDLSIILTYLCYLHTGLTLQQTKQCADCLVLLNPGNRDDWYKKIMEEVTDKNLFPKENEFCASVSAHVSLLHKYAGKTFRLVEFFVMHVVLPKDGYIFEKSLSASSVDLLELPNIIGFSGTKDNSPLWPLGAKLDPKAPLSILSTDGLALSLLQKSVKIIDAFSSSETMNGCIVTTAIKNGYSALIDVGGLLVGINVFEEAKFKWIPALSSSGVSLVGITLYTHFQGKADWIIITNFAIYSKSTAPINVCDTFVIYDQAHCRGADHVLHKNAKALMTTAPKLKRDDALQAAMRMRGLGHGQNIDVLIIKGSECEIELNLIAKDSRIELEHFIAWLVINTSFSMKKLMPLLMHQQMNYFMSQKSMNEQIVFTEDVHVDVNTLYGSPSNLIPLLDHYKKKLETFSAKKQILSPQKEIMKTFIEQRTPGIKTFASGADLNQQTERELEVTILEEVHVQTKSIEMKPKNEFDPTSFLSKIHTKYWFTKANLFDSISTQMLKCTSNFKETITLSTSNKDYARRLPGALIYPSGEVLLISHLEMNAAIGSKKFKTLCFSEKKYTGKEPLLASVSMLASVEEKESFEKTNLQISSDDEIFLDGVIAALCYHGNCKFSDLSCKRLTQLLIPNKHEAVWIPDFIKVHDLKSIYIGSSLHRVCRLLSNQIN